MAPRRLQNLLIANRGEIACRVIRAARGMGMRTVAVYADPDERAAHVRAADRSVPLRGATSGETYLDVAKILDAARRAGADGVHPGYGFLAERADFAEAVLGAGLLWVGPAPEAIRAMGDKLTALARMTEAGVPTLPRALVGAGGADGALAAALEIGFPVIVKTSAGGGGKGMRVVGAAGELAAAVEAAGREAAAAFGDATVFLERFVERARHIEVQVFGNAEGGVRHLFERECSIQRRHQKVIEEAPSPFVDEELRARLTHAAVTAAVAVGYVGAGTVEFVVAPDRSFAFLEMNTRLQVEHPVTELVTGVDLVRAQLRVAQGLSPGFGQLRLRGSAVEARLYAEDPDLDFLPQAGRLLAWDEQEGIRVDAGVTAGDEVTRHFDPMLAKLVAHGADRDEAARRLARGLRDLRVHGLPTNREFLVGILEHPAFLAGDTTIDFVDRVRPARRRVPPAGELRRAAVAAALARRASVQAARDADPAPPIPPGIPPGWGRPLGAEFQGFRHGEDELQVAYRPAGEGRFAATVGGEALDVRVHGWSAPRLDLEIDGLREVVAVTTDDASGRVWV